MSKPKQQQQQTKIILTIKNEKNNSVNRYIQKGKNYTLPSQCPNHTETNQSICMANQPNSFQ